MNALTNLQLELLRVYSWQVSDEDIGEIRKLLANYFAQKAMDKADSMWDKNQWTSQDTVQLASEHNRQPRG